MMTLFSFLVALMFGFAVISQNDGSGWSMFASVVFGFTVVSFGVNTDNFIIGKIQETKKNKKENQQNENE